MMLKKLQKWVKEDCPSPIVPLVILLSCKQAEDQLSFLALGMAGGWMPEREISRPFSS